MLLRFELKIYYFNLCLFFFSRITANLIMLGHGCALGWVSPTLPLLQSVDTPLESGPLTIEETSWVGAILSIGGILGNLFYGCLMERIGTKKTIATLALPQIVRTELVYFYQEID